MTTSSKSKQSNAAQEAHAVLTNMATARSFAPGYAGDNNGELK